MTIIIGAGLSGLTCAKVLATAGHTELIVLDKADQVGGRVATTTTDEGFVLDHGFQVLLDSYPTAARHLDIEALDPCWFRSGTLLADGSRSAPRRLMNPLQGGGGLGELFRLPIGWLERIRLAKLGASVLSQSEEGLGHRRAGISTAQYLEDMGISEETVDLLIRPFFAGVLLDDDLNCDASLFRTYIRRFATGVALVPKRGIQAIPEQLASHLPDGALRLNSAFDSLITEGEGELSRVTGVRLESGEELRCDHVVLAMDGATTAEILDLPKPGFRTTTALYFKSDRALYSEPLLVTQSGRSPLVRNLVQMTNINPNAAPEGQHLVVANIVRSTGKTPQSDLFKAAREEIAQIFPDTAGSLEPLRAMPIRQALPDQVPGFWEPWTNALRHLPQGALLAGDCILQGSIQGAMESGVAAAQTILSARKTGDLHRPTDDSK